MQQMQHHVSSPPYDYAQDTIMWKSVGEKMKDDAMVVSDPSHQVNSYSGRLSDSSSSWSRDCPPIPKPAHNSDEGRNEVREYPLHIVHIHT